jgi:hypothetical protein
MKVNLILLLVFAIAACQSSKTEAPATIQDAFKRLHPDATILQWNDESPVWEAKYKEGNEKGAVSFDANGEVTETELVIDEAQLPNSPVIPDYIKTNYPGEKIQGCEKITLAGGTVTYEIQITGKELVFDADGNFLEVEPD